MPQKPVIETQGHLTTDHETQFVAVGMEGKNWNYEWAFANAQDEDPGGTLVHEADDGNSVVYKFANAGIHRVVIKAKRGAVKVTKEIVIDVQEKPLARTTLPVKIVVNLESNGR